MDFRPLGATGLQVSSVALGCWPMAGMSTPGVVDADGLATILACFDLGINFLDTAFAYGLEGESERLIARALAGRRSEMVIATKGGIEWGEGRRQIIDGHPATLRRQCEESLRRLATDRVELYYLHAPDPRVPIAESAGEIRRLIAEGKALSAGVSNVDLAQLTAFAAECPVTAFQPPYNMLQRDIERDTLPWCQQHGASVMVYWPLLKGLLAGHLPRDHVFAPGDSRLKYPMFQGEEWDKNQDLVDRLREVAADAGADRGPGGNQLDDPSAGHHRRVVRRETARSDQRQCRCHGLAADRRATGAHRRGAGCPRQGDDSSAGVNMKRVLITAFEPYEQWTTNASWLALVELTRDLPQQPQIVTRRYPVDFATLRERLEADLQANFDYALHLGQSPGSSRLRLEAIGINFGAERGQVPRLLASDGPVAYHSRLPLAEWSAQLNAAGIPAAVSYHAGTFLCNAMLYMSCYLAERMALATQSAFIHLPLDVTQTVDAKTEYPSLPTALTSAGLRLILGELAGEE